MLRSHQNWQSQSIREHFFANCHLDCNNFVGLVIRWAIICNWENNALIVDNGKFTTLCINFWVHNLEIWHVTMFLENTVGKFFLMLKNAMTSILVSNYVVTKWLPSFFCFFRSKYNCNPWSQKNAIGYQLISDFQYTVTKYDSIDQIDWNSLQTYSRHFSGSIFVNTCH